MRTGDGTFPTAEAHEQAIQRVLSIGRDLRKPVGLHVLNIEQATTRIGQGMQFVAVGSDLSMLTHTARQIAESLGLAAKADIVRY